MLKAFDIFSQQNTATPVEYINRTQNCCISVALACTELYNADESAYCYNIFCFKWPVEYATKLAITRWDTV
jgi:hypothetical protein